MLNNPISSHAAAQNPAALASDAVASIIEAGGRVLIAQPWRVARIVRGADAMTIDALASHMARRRRAGPPADLNLAIALAQLALAIASPRFRAAWAEWRSAQHKE
ncbi:hypothetical protein [Methylocapsa sp. S129]|uniref:hypothetical protein n=1 Tax=Methylocapsa sp. S129 TaxID=1641869 RepID=UPI00131BED31|nr:hypothetical protein [Methylocapsa sp. S129]